METFPDKQYERSLASAITPEQIEEMFERPSELAIQRAVQLGFNHSAYFHHTKPQEDTPEKQFRYFLENQNLGYREEVIGALHGTEEDMQRFAERVIERRPSVLLSEPSPFAKYVSEERRKECISLVAKSNSFLHNYEVLAAFCEPEDKAKYANLHLDYYKNDEYVDLNDLSAALRYATAYDAHQKKEILRKAMQNGLWLFHRYKPQDLERGTDHRGESAFFLHQAFDNLKYLIQDGLVDTDKLHDDLELRKEDKHPTQIANPESSQQFAEAAAISEMLLVGEGIIHARTPLPRLIVDFLEKQPTSTAKCIDEYDIRRLAYILTSYEFDASEVFPTLEAYDSKRHTRMSELLTIYMDDINRYGYHRYQHPELERHSDDELIQSIGQKYANTDLENDPDRHSDYTQCLNYDGEHKAVARDIIERWYKVGTRKFIGDNSITQLEILFEDEADMKRLKDLLKMKFQEKELDFTTSDWKNIADFLEIDQTTFVDHTLKKLKHHAHIFNYLYELRNGMRFETPLISREQATEMLSERIKEFDVHPSEIGHIRNFCMTYLGLPHTRSLVERLGEDSPVYNLLGDDLESLRARFSDREYYQTYQIVDQLTNEAHRLGPDGVAGYVSSYMELRDDHFVDKLYLAWDYMDADQKQIAMERYLKNPALVGLLASYTIYQRMIQEVGFDRQIAAEQKPDVLTRFAPKAFAHMQRRLSSKDFDEVVLYERRSAERLYPESMEGSRRNILINYAYYYDLSVRIEDMPGVDELVHHIKGKSIEKNELRALELAVLLRETAGVSDGKTLLPKEKSDLERLAIIGTLQTVGIVHDAADKVIENLTSQQVDVVKFGMWLHASFRSEKLQTYFTPFLLHLADGGSVNSWKFDTPLGDNLPSQISGTTKEAWREDTSTDVKIAGGTQLTVNITNDLNSLYLCGARPINNCLHYGYGLNQRASAGLLNADTKLMDILNKNGNPVANAVMRVALYEDKPVLVMEPLYTSEHDYHTRSELHRTALLVAEAYAKVIGVPLHVARLYAEDEEQAYDRYMKEALKTVWSDTEFETRSVLLAHSNAPFTYSDTNGVATKKTYSDTYRRKIPKTTKDKSLPG